MAVKVLRVLFPVLVMLAIGFFCRKTGAMDEKGAGQLKHLVTKIILPTAIFNALATATFDRSTLALVGIMLVMMIVSFALGFAMKPLMGEKFRRYIPFMVSVYEGGMMAYPLYTNLVGAENLSHIAMLDIAGLIFGFSVYMSMLSQVDGGKPFTFRQMVRDSLHNPAFIAAVLGVICGALGLGRFLTEGGFGEVYSATVSLVTAAMSSMILLLVGFDLRPSRDMLGPCLKTVVMRAVLQAVMILGVLWAVHRFVGQEPLLDTAVIIYMSAPATFSMQSFVHSEDGGAYVSTTNSLYCLVSIAVYAVMAGIGV